MKINLDDPNLTAYALGELRGEEAAAMEKAVAESAEARAYVEETRELAGVLRADFRAELEEPRPHNILPLPEARSFWSDARWASLGVAALLAIATVVGAVLLAPRWSGGLASSANVGRRATPPSDVQMEFLQEAPRAAESVASMATTKHALALKAESEPLLQAALAAPASDAYSAGLVYAESKTRLPGNEMRTTRSKQLAAETDAQSQQSFNTAEYDHFEENPFLAATSNPLSTFSIDVDTASYANVRRFLNTGSLPPREAVRIEEMINYFHYDYPQPQGSDPFSVNLEVAGCPWQPDHRLVRIGLKGREVPNDKRGASNLVFLLDVSGSMEPSNRLPLIKQAMRLLVEKLTESDRVAIVVYAGSSGLVLDSTPGNEKEKIFAALENLQAGGSTNGAGGIELAYHTAAEHFIKGGINRVILATDGDFNVGVTSQGELVRLAEEKAKSGVFLSVLGVGDDNLRDSTMQKLADKGNGNYAYLDSLDEARKVLVQQMNGTLVTIAKDVKVQVEFNPARVASYRLIGYEKRMLRKEDFNNDKVDAGEIGAGHTVTALYEIVPVGAGANSASSVPPVDPLKYQTPDARLAAASLEMLTVKLRYKEPDGEVSKLTERTLADSGASFAAASPDLKFAAAVAEFGMILRASPHKGDGSLGGVLEWAQEGRGADAAGYRAGFLELVRKAQRLTNG